MKYYVVWQGRQPGVYDNWNDAKEQIEHFPGARYKSYRNCVEATEAFRNGSSSEEEALGSLLLQAAEMKEEKAPEPVCHWRDIPEVRQDAIAVDASCLGNPGRMEYRGVDLATGREIFRIGPFDDATNNIGEYLALVHILALMKKRGIERPVYSDSRTALSWLRRRGSRTTLKPTPRNTNLLQLLTRADIWVKNNRWNNLVLKWDTDNWGEIPADFGRK